MALFDALGIAMGSMRGRIGAKACPEVLDSRGQLRLVVLHCQNVIGAAIPDDLSDVGLCAHGVDGDRATFQRQGGEQLWNGGLLVGLLCVALCPSTSPAPAAKSD